MKLRNLVSVIVAGLALCIILSVTCEAAATTKATTTDKEIALSAKKNTESTVKKTTSKKKTAVTKKKETTKSKTTAKKAAAKKSKKTTVKKNTKKKTTGTTKKKATAKKTTKKKTTKKNTTPAPQFNFTDVDVRYLTSIIYCEARGEGYAGQKAVGIVVMNRVRDYQFPNSVTEVIYQRGQFSPVRNGSLNKALAIFDSQWATGYMQGDMASCMLAAREALMGSTTVAVSGGNVEMGSYLFFSRYIPNARFQLGAHQFK
ncbi:MAG: cell wall hydrolase [Bacteroidales bacterium]|nr:cell wall hydrolase [Clostridium sp.]MCM1204395.1 cell wall hydrolase [Bacteroidales bacterium]